MKTFINNFSILYVFLVCIMISCGTSSVNENNVIQTEGNGIPEPQNIPYTVLNAYTHDTAAFTQGLEIYKGQMLESTGLEGRSSLRKVNEKNGKVSTLKKLDNELFGEGITVLRDTLYQLTWQNHIVLVYDPVTFKQIRTMEWKNEGWGITTDGKYLIISDGSDKLYFTNPNDLKIEKIVSVSDNYGPLNNINELEYINNTIYANRLDFDHIIRIDPSNGHVTGRMDLRDILKKYSKTDISYIETNLNGAVLNGIAWDSTSKKMYITGKLWPLLFELQVEP
ncbi:MAG: glutaminyl-peptide cyclotransferase [Chitinophagaceae bacterium]